MRREESKANPKALKQVFSHSEITDNSHYTTLSEDDQIIQEYSNENQIKIPNVHYDRSSHVFNAMQNTISQYASAVEFLQAVIPIRKFIVNSDPTNLMRLKGAVNSYMKIFDLINIKTPNMTFDYMYISLSSTPVCPSICVIDKCMNMNHRVYECEDIVKYYNIVNPINHIVAQFSEMGCLQYLYFYKIGRFFGDTEVVISKEQFKIHNYSLLTDSEVVALNNIDCSILIKCGDDGKYILEWTEMTSKSVRRVRYAISSDFDISQISSEKIIELEFVDVLLKKKREELKKKLLHY